MLTAIGDVMRKCHELGYTKVDDVLYSEAEYVQYLRNKQFNQSI